MIVALVVALLALLGYIGANPTTLPVVAGGTQICNDCNEESFPHHCPKKQCTDDAPYCATITTGPNYTSILTCEFGKGSRPCQLSYSQSQGYKLVCFCDNNLCNTVFNEELKRELIKFAAVNAPTAGKGTNYFDTFKEQSMIFKDISDSYIYHYWTGDYKGMQPTQKLSNRKSIWEEMPLAEALRHETTVPSDDDEDESEGSGSYEEHSSAPPPPAAAATSPRPPATTDSSAAPLLFFNILSTTPAILLHLLRCSAFIQDMIFISKT